MANTVDKLLAIAEAEVGYLEKSKSAYTKDPSVLDKKTEGAGSDNYTKYGRDMHSVYPSVMDFPAYWCDCFVDWCFYKAYGVATAKSLLGGNFDDYTVASAQQYKNKKAWYTSSPKIGDQIFFKNSSTICHTGIVYKVDSTKVYTIEGNTSGTNTVVSNGGGVAKKSYLLTNSSIAGYGRPNYDYLETESTKTTTIKKTNTEIAQEVIAGKWGSGTQRKDKLTTAGYNYSEIQPIVNSILSGKPVVNYFNKYTGSSVSIVEALRSLGIDVSMTYRTKIAIKNGILGYKGLAIENEKLLFLLKQGQLIKP